MSSSKRPSTSSLRRFISSRPYLPIAEIRRRFEIEDREGMCRVEREGEVAFIGLPEREASKIQDLWSRDEIGLELSVEVRAPVVIGVYPMRIARYLTDGNGFRGNGHSPAVHAPDGQVQEPPHVRSHPDPSPSLGHAAGSR